MQNRQAPTDIVEGESAVEVTETEATPVVKVSAAEATPVVVVEVPEAEITPAVDGFMEFAPSYLLTMAAGASAAQPAITPKNIAAVELTDHNLDSASRANSPSSQGNAAATSDPDTAAEQEGSTTADSAATISAATTKAITAAVASEPVLTHPIPAVSKPKPVLASAPLAAPPAATVRASGYVANDYYGGGSAFNNCGGNCCFYCGNYPASTTCPSCNGGGGGGSCDGGGEGLLLACGAVAASGGLICLWISCGDDLDESARRQDCVPFAKNLLCSGMGAAAGYFIGQGIAAAAAMSYGGSIAMTTFSMISGAGTMSCISRCIRPVEAVTHSNSNTLFARSSRSFSASASQSHLIKPSASFSRL